MIRVTLPGHNHRALLVHSNFGIRKLHPTLPRSQQGFTEFTLVASLVLFNNLHLCGKA